VDEVAVLVLWSKAKGSERDDAVANVRVEAPEVGTRFDHEGWRWHVVWHEPGAPPSAEFYRYICEPLGPVAE
jgi:hypothetical protein